jgi:D-arabinitol 4-dehydrogenase
LHLGLGAFHRAHQAVYLQRLHESGDTRWILAGGNIRNDAEATIAALTVARGAYTLETISFSGEHRYERIQSIRTVVPWSGDLRGLIELGADPNIRIISFTVTESGYYLDGSDRLDVSNAEIAADLQRARSGAPGSTIYGALVAILRARRAAGAGSVTLLSCDNVRHNGDRFRAGFMEFLDQLKDASLGHWIEANISCPNGMVDRITPRPGPDVRERVQAATGVDDGAALMSERCIQWVIEEDFIAGRPAWERVGAQMVESVTPFEEAKIRILNGSHCALAWAGTLAGYTFIDEAAREPFIQKVARDYITDAVIPCLTALTQPYPIDLARYRDEVLERFANVAIADRLSRVAMDSFSKLPGFIAPTIIERLAAHQSVRSSALLPALFLRFLQRWRCGALPYSYEDRAMDPLMARQICDAADPVAALCHSQPLFGSAAGHPALASAVGESLQTVDQWLAARSASLPRKSA